MEIKILDISGLHPKYYGKTYLAKIKHSEENKLQFEFSKTVTKENKKYYVLENVEMGDIIVRWDERGFFHYYPRTKFYIVAYSDGETKKLSNKRIKKLFGISRKELELEFQNKIKERESSNND